MAPIKGEEEDEDEELETIRRLIEESRSAEGRSRLASKGIVLPMIVSLLRSDLPHQRLVSFLRLLRNLCAGESASQNALLDAGGVESTASIVLDGVDEIVIRLGLQLLGNVTASGELHRSRIWGLLFCDGFLVLARVRDAVACDALCMILCMCCCSPGPESRGRFSDLLYTGSGLPILKEIISTARAGGFRGDWIQILLSRVCFQEEEGLPRLISQSSGLSFTADQTFLLGILASLLNEQTLEPDQISNGFSLAIIEILKEAAIAVDFTARGTSSLPTGSPAVDALGYTLAILRDLAATVENTPASSLLSPVEPLISSGVCRLLLSLLRDLEPPSSVRKSIPSQPNTTPPKVCPYRGFRRDLVAVIGNLAHRRRQVQDEVREQEGVILLLQQCVLDEDNPFLREWGLLAVSYLLEGNAENQRLVAELQLQAPVDSPELAELQLRVDVDKITGRVKLVNT
ncbi:ARM repeat superfamily protein [Wolffia australiana]